MNNAEKLKSFRLKHNLTQQQLADLLGVKQQIIKTGNRLFILVNYYTNSGWRMSMTA